MRDLQIEFTDIIADVEDDIDRAKESFERTKCVFETLQNCLYEVNAAINSIDETNWREKVAELKPVVKQAVCQSLKS